jgi:hypothetical protein
MSMTARSQGRQAEASICLTLSEPLGPRQVRSISHAWDGGALASARDAPVMIGGDVVQMARDLARAPVPVEAAE